MPAFPVSPFYDGDTDLTPPSMGMQLSPDVRLPPQHVQPQSASDADDSGGIDVSSQRPANLPPDDFAQQQLQLAAQRRLALRQAAADRIKNAYAQGDWNAVRAHSADFLTQGGQLDGVAGAARALPWQTQRGS